MFFGDLGINFGIVGQCVFFVLVDDVELGLVFVQVQQQWVIGIVLVVVYVFMVGVDYFVVCEFIVVGLLVVIEGYEWYLCGLQLGGVDLVIVDVGVVLVNYGEFVVWFEVVGVGLQLQCYWLCVIQGCVQLDQGNVVFE